MIRTWPAYIPLPATRDLAGLTLGRVVGIDIEVTVAIGIVKNRIADPHGITRGPGTFCDSLGIVALQIKDVENVRLAAAVTLFRSKIARLRRVNKLRPVWR